MSVKNQKKSLLSSTKLRDKVKKLKNELNAIKALETGSPKQQFIDQYGIELQMPANYIYEAIFYRPDPKYVITANCQIFPMELDFYDYNKIGTDQDPSENDYAENEEDFNNCLLFKVLQFQGDRYHQIQRRVCNSHYQNKICFSEDKMKIAIFREFKKKDHDPGTSHSNQTYVIDIFDCSKIDFFLKDTMLSPEDENLLFTIEDPNLYGSTKFEKSFMRFSANQKYLYISQQRKTFIFYDLQHEGKIISKAQVVETIPSMYEYIMNVAIDEYDIKESIVALKRADFKNIDFFPLAMLQEINQGSLNASRISKTIKDLNQFKQKYQMSSIRLEEFDLRTANLKFSGDHTQAIYCDSYQSILLELAQEGMKQHQKTISHMNGKKSRFIQRFGDYEFLIVSANDQDKEIQIRHSSNPDKKIRFYFRYCDGSVQVRDLLIYDNKIRILVTRDDEEFIIYEWENFQEKEIFWQRFLESSNYIFEWPYLCYLKGPQHIIIQNTYNPNLAFFFEQQDIGQDSIISNMFITEQFYLYVIVSTKTQYKIYETDLDKCMPYILNEVKDAAIFDDKYISGKNKALTLKLKQEQMNEPIATISKSYLGNKSIYKFFVRSHSDKEVYSQNQERIIFFLCNFKIYCIIGSDISVVDQGYKFRNINPNLIAYNTVDNRGRKTNEIKYLSMADSDYQCYKIYEEMDGKLVEFLVQDGQLLILSKPEKSESHALKIFEVNSAFQVKLKYLIHTKDENFIGNIQTINYFQNNMIPAFNTVYTIVYNGEYPIIHEYNEVIPILPNSGNQLSFYAPLLNLTYRKMIYFITNKKFLKPKRGIILPYLIDNFILFNKRTKLIQNCQFQEYRNPVTKKQETEILCFVPLTKQLLHYNLKGQLIRLLRLDKIYENYGDTNLAASPNGMYHLSRFQDEIQHNNLFIICKQIHTEESQTNSLTNSRPESPNTKKKLDVKQMKLLMDQRQKSNNNPISNVMIKLLEQIKTDEIEILDETYRRFNMIYLSQAISYYQSQHCEIIYKMNNEKDVIIGFLYISQTKSYQKPIKELKELFLLKNQRNGKRVCFKIRLQQQEMVAKERSNSMIQIDQDSLKEKLLAKSNTADSAGLDEQEFSILVSTKNLQGCYNFNMTDEKIIVWSKDKIFEGSLDRVNSNTFSINLTKVKFEIENLEEAQIESVNAIGQNQEDINEGNYYIYIKIIVENSYAFLMKYNIIKGKEFSAFDCHINAQIFFDTKCEGYILDHDSIIDIDQGIPLYFYKTGMQSIESQYLLHGSIASGPRFCSKNLHFMIRNKTYLPYSYFILVLLESNKNQPITNLNYDPEAFYQHEGATILHKLANNYKAMEFILTKYQETNQRLLNMIFLKDSNQENVLQLAIQYGNTRCVKLILDKLANVSMNNIHALKKNFPQLLNYNGFEDYLRLCFFDTNQMTSKIIFSRKFAYEKDNFYIAPHSTTFLDKEFYENFQDTSKASRQVIIRAIDAGWILKDSHGARFLVALSNSDNMDYFAIDTVKLVVKYQWNIMKPLIIKWLFIPFIFNMILFNFYCIFTFEKHIRAKEDGSYNGLNIAVEVILLIFSIQTVYVELQQIRFHQKEYLQSFWNMLDLIAVIMVPLIVILDFANSDPENIRPLMAYTNLLFYMRFFYFLRIFDNSAHLVRTIIEITSDLRNFMFVFFLAIIGFGQGFFILSNNNDPNEKDAQFIENVFAASIYAYRMSLGDFQLNPLDKSTDIVLIWLLYIFCSLFTTIIMLNMLVAIMGDSFNRVNEQRENQRIRENLQLIVENDFLLDRKKTFGHVKYLIEIKDDVEEDDQDVVTQKIHEIGNMINSQRQESKQERLELKEMVKHQNDQMISLKTEISKIKHLLRQATQIQGIQTEQTVVTYQESQNTMQRE